MQKTKVEVISKHGVTELEQFNGVFDDKEQLTNHLIKACEHLNIEFKDIENGTLGDVYNDNRFIVVSFVEEVAPIAIYIDNNIISNTDDNITKDIDNENTD